MNLEMLVAVLIFLVSLALIFWDRKFSVYVLMILSLFLHKELFSFYRWNLLPIRIFMFAFFVWGLYEFSNWFLNNRDFKKLWEYLKKPFILLLLSLWLIRGISIVFTKNLFSSVTLFGFFSTMVVLGIYLYFSLKDKPEEVLNYIKFYIYAVFGLSVFAYLQAYLFLKHEIIIGALWNVPGKFPRLGSLFWDVNHFGGLLAGLLPVLGALILTTKSWGKRILYSFMFLSMSVVLLLTNSRTSWILGFVAFIAFVGILLFRKFGTRGILAIILVLTLVSSLGLMEYMNKDSPFRKRIKDYFHYRIDSFESHLMLLQGSFEVFEKYPYLGGGYGGFFEHFSETDVAARYFGRDPAALNTRVPAHTIWGEVVSETGVLGLVSFVLFVTLILGTLLYLALNTSNMKNVFISTAMFSSILGWLTAGTFYSYNSEFFFIVLFLYFLYGAGVLAEDYDLNKILSFFKDLGALPLLIISVIALSLIFFGLGKNHLIPWDEAIYAGIAKNMVKTGEYLIQRWGDSNPWYEKPPLYMWFMSGVMKVFGFGSFAPRLPSALLGFGTILAVYLFAKKYFDRGVAFISSLALVTTVHFLYYSRASMLDVSTTFFISVSLFLYYQAKNRVLSEKKHYSSISFVLSGVAFGLAVMTKGIVGLLPLPIMVLYEFYLLVTSQEKLRIYILLDLILVFLSGAIVFLPWHLYMFDRFGSAFLENYLGYHVLDRALTAIEDKGRPFFWYWVVIKVSMRVWFIVLIPAVFYALSRIFKKDNRWAFLFIWMAFVFLFFSSARSKLVWYIMPLYPAAALIIGAFIKKMLDLVLGKFPKWDTNLMRFIFFFFLTSFSLFYLFLNKDLVYTSDLTGSQAKLLILKDEKFGGKTKVYADRIELPLVLYYSEGPAEIVDFGPLKKELNSAGGERLVFITKESRFRAFKEIYPDLILEKQINEWVLGYLPAEKEPSQELNVAAE